jgi:GTPase
VATAGDGVEELWRAVADHRAHIEATGELARRRAARARDELRGVVGARLEARARAIVGDATWAGVTDRVARGELDAWSGADLLLGE